MCRSHHQHAPAELSEVDTAPLHSDLSMKDVAAASAWASSPHTPPHPSSLSKSRSDTTTATETLMLGKKASSAASAVDAANSATASSGDQADKSLTGVRDLETLPMKCRELAKDGRCPHGWTCGNCLYSRAPLPEVDDDYNQRFKEIDIAKEDWREGRAGSKGKTQEK